MVEFGYFLSTEEQGPRSLVRIAGQAEANGFRTVWISDHFHPWTSAQGQSPFVWAPIGGIAATTDLKITTAVTCPTFRIHPAIVAQAAATAAVMTEGRFRLGVGSGENLNEHILGQVWPSVDVRLEMLEEAVEVMRKLWTGDLISHRGRYYAVDNARLYTVPDEPPEVHVSGFGPQATALAARIGDGYITMSPDPELLAVYDKEGGRGVKAAGLKGCWARDESEALQTAMRWANEGLPGQLAQELPMPSHFEQAITLVTEDMIAESTPVGPDPQRWVAAITEFVDAGFDEIYINQIGDDQDGFFQFWRDELHPRLV
jgi:G6PDH family F420-dependent oxidoreductase